MRVLFVPVNSWCQGLVQMTMIQQGGLCFAKCTGDRPDLLVQDK